MHVLRINTEPKLAHTEEVLRQIRYRLPLAYLKPRTGKGFIDFTLDVPAETLAQLKSWLLYCGWDAEIANA